MYWGRSDWSANERLTRQYILELADGAIPVDRRQQDAPDVGIPYRRVPSMVVTLGGRGRFDGAPSVPELPTKMAPVASSTATTLG